VPSSQRLVCGPTNANGMVAAAASKKLLIVTRPVRPRAASVLTTSGSSRPVGSLSPLRTARPWPGFAVSAPAFSRSVQEPQIRLTPPLRRNPRAFSAARHQARNDDTVVFRANIGRISNLTLRQTGGGDVFNAVDILQGRLLRPSPGAGAGPAAPRAAPP
jgi:hypothetical protein